MLFNPKLIWFLIIICLTLTEISGESDKTVLLLLHGRGESAGAGNAHSFYTRFNTVLRNRSISEYNVINIGLSDSSDEDYDWSSYRSMDFQSEKLCSQLKRPEIWEQLIDAKRVILVGFSQGGLLWRGILWGNCLDPLLPKVDKLITFGGPHSGVFGKPDCSQMDTKYKVLIKVCEWIQKFDDLTGKGPALYDIFMYSSMAELAFSASSYWNSPSNKEQRNTWLAHIDNENNPSGDKYLSQKLNRGMVLIGFGKEDTVLPPISSYFGYWDSNAKNWIKFNETQLYLNDWIGLKELNQKHLLDFYTIENEAHMSIPDHFINNRFLQFLN